MKYDELTVSLPEDVGQFDVGEEGGISLLHEDVQIGRFL